VRASNLAVAVITATIAFWAYTQTLLPGVDLGDTGGFQAAVLWPAVSARQAYPLYYSLAKPFVATLSAAHPARGLNLFSALWGACAVALLALVVIAVTESRAGGVIAGLFLAFSYTFWSQSIIAEVYTLHLTIVGACLLALVWYAARPSVIRLAAFCLLYAVGFGNHLSMIILFVPFAVFILLTNPAPRRLFRPRIVALVIGLAVVGALQYTPNFLQVWSGIDAPAAWSDRLAAFWFDTTKADWRETMVLGVGASKAAERVAMWGWDARQQFGIIGLVIAGVGAIRIWRISRAWATLTWLAYACTTLFAVTYNVGDSHVFFLPSHYFTALFAGVAIASLNHSHPQPWRRALVTAATVFVAAYIGWRAWDTWPMIDRHDDTRAETLVARIANGADESRAVILSAMDWQSDNALLYSSRWERRNLAWTRLADVLPQLPFFVADNHGIDRDVVLTTDAAAQVAAAYGSLFPLEPIDPLDEGSLATVAARIPKGAPFVLTLLKPTPDVRFNAADYDAAVTTLTNGRARPRSGRAFEMLAGVAGDPATIQRSSDRPFHQSAALAGDLFTVRMESWLPDDTFRRAGFGHVLHGRHRILIVERGASLVWLGNSGEPRVAYAAGLYEPRPRFRIPRARLELAALPRGSRP
jgi:hypothetical protein